MLRKNKGITLVALVVTIVILLILAGVTLNMVLGENGIVRKANESRSKMRIASDAEAVQMATFGIMIDGDLTLEKLQTELNKTRPGEFTISESEGIITVSFTGGKSYTVNKATGEIALLGPSVQVANVKVVNGEGTEVAVNSQEAETLLYIKFTASIEEGSITSVKYNGTETISADGNGVYTKEINQNGDYSFEIIGTVEGENYPLNGYIVTVNQYAKVEFEAADIGGAASTYYGAYVTNYTAGWEYIKGVTESTKGTSWKIFYAGKLHPEVTGDANDTESIYLIASNYIHYTGMPTVEVNSEIKTANVTYTSNNETLTYPYRGNFTNVKAGYSTGSSAIANNMQYLNANYYAYLTSTSQTSTNDNMKSVAYMLDTAKWNTFYKTSDADWAIGGPSLELLFASYNSKYSTNYKAGDKDTTYTSGENTLHTIVLNGYKVSNSSGTSGWSYSASLSQNDLLYRIGSTGNDGVGIYWLASPSTNDGNDVMLVASDGSVRRDTNISYVVGFRPIVRLNSSVKLEPDPLSSGNYRIAD